MALTPDGKRAVSASWDKTLKVWDLERGQVLRTLEGHTGFVTAVALTPDGSVRSRPAGTRRSRCGISSAGRCCARSKGILALSRRGADGGWQVAYSASEDNTLKVWDLERGEVLRTLEGQTRTVTPWR